ncbi:hypothetical protein CTI12_AA005900 [Artemisia annua]|uniref:Uncharacterized protein n=1 Tax=Artemisia annua TaxID=35608 RepID=A0A2U1QNF4_ARTAN|nr:hypothetical protein CTI12_AA005900 [Artemisia annua]
MINYAFQSFWYKSQSQNQGKFMKLDSIFMVSNFIDDEWDLFSLTYMRCHDYMTRFRQVKYCEESIVSSPPAPEKFEIPAKGLPENGKFLEAVMKAGPLLNNLLLAGQLPHWRHPPPPLNCHQIPSPPLVVPPPPIFCVTINTCENAKCGSMCSTTQATLNNTELLTELQKQVPPCKPKSAYVAFNFLASIRWIPIITEINVYPNCIIVAVGTEKAIHDWGPYGYVACTDCWSIFGFNQYGETMTLFESSLRDNLEGNQEALDLPNLPYYTIYDTNDSILQRKPNINIPQIFKLATRYTDQHNYDYPKQYPTETYGLNNNV